MPGQNPANDHWKRLASELGLELDPEPVEAQPEPTPPPQDEPPPPTDQFVSANEWTMETVSATWTAGPETADELPPPLPTGELPTGETERSEAEGEDEPRRRRRRGRRRKSDKENVAVREAEPDASSDDEDDATVEIVRDWDIPSWNDLIASLYRPER